MGCQYFGILAHSGRGVRLELASSNSSPAASSFHSCSRALVPEVVGGGIGLWEEPPHMPFDIGILRYIRRNGDDDVAGVGEPITENIAQIVCHALRRTIFHPCLRIKYRPRYTHWSRSGNSNAVSHVAMWVAVCPGDQCDFCFSFARCCQLPILFGRRTTSCSSKFPGNGCQVLRGIRNFERLS